MPKRKVPPKAPPPAPEPEPDGGGSPAVPAPPPAAHEPVSGTTLETLLGYVREAEFALASRGSKVSQRPWGAILASPEFPLCHEANMAWVERLPKGGISPVLIEYDSAMRATGISYRHLEFWDPAAAEAAGERLLADGFRAHRSLALVRLGYSTCVRNPDLEIREVDTPEEREVFEAILGEIHTESAYSEAVSRQLVARFRARGPAIGERPFLGLFAGEGAGIGTLVPRKKLALLDEVATRPKFRRRGVARTIVEELSMRGQQLGFPYVGLVTGFDNEAARSLYASLGYSPVGEIRGFHRA